MPAILFVCTVNRFRSPIAEAYFIRKLALANRTDSWTVSSAGTWAPEGLPAHPKAITAAAKMGLDLKPHRTHEVSATMLERADLVVVMENGHKESLESEFPHIRGRVILLGSLADIPGDEIPDAAWDNFTHPDSMAHMVCVCIDKAFDELIRLANENHFGKPSSKLWR
jgi:protein-tyrosine phosphatase